MLMSAGYEVPQQLLDPRLPDGARGQDVEVGRQRARPVPRDRAVRPGRAAVLPVPRRAVRLATATSRTSASTIGSTSELANDLGNLLSRTVAMTGRYRDGVAPSGTVDLAIRATLERSAAAFAGHVDRFELTEALEAAWESVRALNRFVEERAPWKLAKDPAAAAELDDGPVHAARRPAGDRGHHRLVRPRRLGRHPRGRRLRRQRGELGQRRTRPLPAGAPTQIDGPLFPRVDEPLS